MRYAQIRFTDEEFLMLKKAHLKTNISFEKFLKNAIFKKLFFDTVKESLKSSKKEKQNG